MKYKDRAKKARCIAQIKAFSAIASSRRHLASIGAVAQTKDTTGSTANFCNALSDKGFVQIGYTFLTIGHGGAMCAPDEKQDNPRDNDYTTMCFGKTLLTVSEL